MDPKETHLFPKAFKGPIKTQWNQKGLIGTEGPLGNPLEPKKDPKEPKGFKRTHWDSMDLKGTQWDPKAFEGPIGDQWT